MGDSVLICVNLGALPFSGYAYKSNSSHTHMYFILSERVTDASEKVLRSSCVFTVKKGEGNYIFKRHMGFSGIYGRIASSLANKQFGECSEC